MNRLGWIHLPALPHSETHNRGWDLGVCCLKTTEGPAYFSRVFFFFFLNNWDSFVLGHFRWVLNELRFLVILVWLLMNLGIWLWAKPNAVESALSGKKSSDVTASGKALWWSEECVKSNILKGQGRSFLNSRRITGYLRLEQAAFTAGNAIAPVTSWGSSTGLDWSPAGLKY